MSVILASVILDSIILAGHGVSDDWSYLIWLIDIHGFRGFQFPVVVVVWKPTQKVDL